VAIDLGHPGVKPARHGVEAGHPTPNAAAPQLASLLHLKERKDTTARPVRLDQPCVAARRESETVESKAMSSQNGNTHSTATGLRLKVGLAEMLKGGVIMDVMSVEQARIAEEAGAASVMALERVPAMIRAEGGVARMAKPSLIRQIIQAVSIPVMAKARIGHFAEAQILQELGVDFIDESEVLTPADETHHIDKHAFKTPFVCGARNLGEALRRIAEGAAMIRTKGEAGTGDVVHAVQHMRQITRQMRELTVLTEQELYAAAKDLQAPYELVRMVAQSGKLPVPNFSAGGIATPADAALMMQLGAEAIFVGSGIFMKERATPLEVENWTGKDAEAGLCSKSDIGTPRNPAEREEAVSRAKAIVIATTHYNDPKVLAEVSEQVTGTMKGLAAAAIEQKELLQTRGW
jgi:pyridoxal 5'-phosphate synthase pdxS subunit